MCLAEPITNDNGFTVINKSNYNIGDGISTKIHFYAQLADLVYKTSGPDRNQIIKAPWSIYDGSKGPNDYVPYEKAVDNDNLLIYTPYGTLSKTTFPLSTYPNYVIIRGSQTLYDYWKVANLITLQPNANDSNAYDTNVDLVKGLIQNFLTEEDEYLIGNRNLVFLGHSQGGMMMLDIYHQFFAQHQQLFHLDCLHIFNPFIIPTPEYLEIREICKDSTHDDYTAYRTNINIHKTKDDFASSLVKVVGVGNVFIYPNVVESLYAASGIINTAYETYKTYQNHRQPNFSAEGNTNEGARYPHPLTEYTNLSSFMLTEKEANKPILIRTNKADSMPAYFEEAGTTHHLKLRNVNVGSLKVDTRAGGGIDTASYEWTISNIDKSTFYEYDITLLNQTTSYITPLYTLTNGGESLYVFFKYTGDPSTYVIINSDGKVYQIKHLVFNIKDYPENINLVPVTTYSTTTHSLDYYLRGQWKLYDSNTHLSGGLSTNWHVDGPRRLLSYSLLGELFNLSYSITSFDSYLISTSAWYIDNSSLQSGDRFLIPSTDNDVYYIAPSGTWSGTVDSIEGLQATNPDSEVFNISYDTTYSNWKIINSANTTLIRLLQWISGSQVATSSYNDISSADLPYTNHDTLIEYHSTVATDRLYQISFVKNTVKHYLICSMTHWTYTNGNFGYLDAVSQTHLDSNTGMTPATLWKIADNVNTIVVN